MFDKKIKIKTPLFDKLTQAAAAMGVSAVDEFAEAVLEREADRVLAAKSRPELSQKEVEDIANKLKGLGYLD